MKYISLQREAHLVLVSRNTTKYSLLERQLKDQI